MKLALVLTDQSFISTKSVGIFNVSMGLAYGLMKCPEVKELHILGNEECADSFRNVPSHVHLHLLDKPVPRRFKRVWWDQVGVCAAVRKIAPDWVLMPKGFPPFFPCFGGARLACYVHDINWEYYELKGAMTDSPYPKHELAYFRALGLRALRQSDLVLTSTHFNLSRFTERVPEVKCKVVGIGFDTPEEPEHEEKGRDVLFYASPFPHKLTALGVNYMQEWLNAHAGQLQDMRIHIIGRLPSGVVTEDERWVSHGRLPQAELERLIKQECRVAVYFSDYEGFGMPPVESLRAGLPCVASDIPPIHENIPARYLFDNESVASFIATMDEAYFGTTPLERPSYPNWEQVANCAARAMLEAL